MLRKFIQKRKVDQSTDTTQKDHTIASGFKSGAQFDDRIDTAPEVTHREALKIIFRGYQWLKYVKGLFFTRWAMKTMILVPSLYIGWFTKIVVDHVILQVPLVADEASFPPHFHWYLVFPEGREPLDIALILVTVYVFGLFLIGSRTGGTGADLYAGRDAASNAENAVSGGGGGRFTGSDAGGIWGIAEWWVSVRLAQRFINRIRTDLFKRLTKAPMTRIDDSPSGQDRLPRRRRSQGGGRSRRIDVARRWSLSGIRRSPVIDAASLALRLVFRVG